MELNKRNPKEGKVDNINTSSPIKGDTSLLRSANPNNAYNYTSYNPSNSSQAVNVSSPYAKRNLHSGSVDLKQFLQGSTAFKADANQPSSFDAKAQESNSAKSELTASAAFKTDANQPSSFAVKAQESNNSAKSDLTASAAVDTKADTISYASHNPSASLNTGNSPVDAKVDTTVDIKAETTVDAFAEVRDNRPYQEQLAQDRQNHPKRSFDMEARRAKTALAKEQALNLINGKSLESKSDVSKQSFAYHNDSQQEQVEQQRELTEPSKQQAVCEQEHSSKQDYAFSMGSTAYTPKDSPYAASNNNLSGRGAFNPYGYDQNSEVSSAQGMSNSSSQTRVEGSFGGYQAAYGNSKQGLSADDSAGLNYAQRAAQFAQNHNVYGIGNGNTSLYSQATQEQPQQSSAKTSLYQQSSVESKDSATEASVLKQPNVEAKEGATDLSSAKQPSFENKGSTVEPSVSNQANVEANESTATPSFCEAETEAKTEAKEEAKTAHLAAPDKANNIAPASQEALNIATEPKKRKKKPSSRSKKGSIAKGFEALFADEEEIAQEPSSKTTSKKSPRNKKAKSEDNLTASSSQDHQSLKAELGLLGLLEQSVNTAPSLNSESQSIANVEAKLADAEQEALSSKQESNNIAASKIEEALVVESHSDNLDDSLNSTQNQAQDTLESPSKVVDSKASVSEPLEAKKAQEATAEQANQVDVLKADDASEKEHHQSDSSSHESHYGKELSDSGNASQYVARTLSAREQAILQEAIENTFYQAEPRDDFICDTDSFKTSDPESTVDEKQVDAEEVAQESARDDAQANAADDTQQVANEPAQGFAEDSSLEAAVNEAPSALDGYIKPFSDIENDQADPFDDAPAHVEDDAQANEAFDAQEAPFEDTQDLDDESIQEEFAFYAQAFADQDDTLAYEELVVHDASSVNIKSLAQDQAVVHDVSSVNNEPSAQAASYSKPFADAAVDAAKSDPVAVANDAPDTISKPRAERKTSSITERFKKSLSKVISENKTTASEVEKISSSADDLDGSNSSSDFYDPLDHTKKAGIRSLVKQDKPMSPKERYESELKDNSELSLQARKAYSRFAGSFDSQSTDNSDDDFLDSDFDEADEQHNAFEVNTMQEVDVSAEDFLSSVKDSMKALGAQELMRSFVEQIDRPSASEMRENLEKYQTLKELVRRKVLDEEAEKLKLSDEQIELKVKAMVSEILQKACNKEAEA